MMPKTPRYRTKDMVLDWYGPEVMALVNRASGDALAKGAAVLGRDVKARLAAMATARPSGWGWWKHRYGPGYVSREIRWGKFQTGKGFTGGFVRLPEGLWHLIEMGTGRSKARPHLRPAIAANKSAILRAALSDTYRALGRAA